MKSWSSPSMRARASRAGASVAAALEEGHPEFGILALKVKGKSRQGAGGGVRARGAREGPNSRRSGAPLTWPRPPWSLPPGTRPSWRERLSSLPLSDGVRLQANPLHLAHAGERRGFGRRRRHHRRNSRRSTRRRRQRSALAVDALVARATTSVEPEDSFSGRLPTACPTSTNLGTKRRSEELGLRLAECSLVWLKMCASAEPSARATSVQGRQSQAASATDVEEVEKGYSLAAARAEADALPGSASAPASGPVSAEARRGLRHHRQRPRREGRWSARSRPKARALRSSAAT